MIVAGMVRPLYAIVAGVVDNAAETSTAYASHICCVVARPVCGAATPLVGAPPFTNIFAAVTVADNVVLPTFIVALAPAA